MANPASRSVVVTMQGSFDYSKWAVLVPGSLFDMQSLGPGIGPTDSESVLLTGLSGHLYESFKGIFLNFGTHRSALDDC